MIDSLNFRQWLTSHTNYSDAVIGDIVSRAKRADNIKEWSDDEVYLFLLGKDETFMKMSMSVKSQLRKSIKLYSQFMADKE